MTSSFMTSPRPTVDAWGETLRQGAENGDSAGANPYLCRPGRFSTAFESDDEDDRGAAQSTASCNPNPPTHARRTPTDDSDHPASPIELERLVAKGLANGAPGAR